MNNKAQRSTQSFRRVTGWKTAHAEVLNAAPAAVSVFFTRLDELTARIEANATTQDVQHRLSTRSATDATIRRTAVRDAMLPITQVAKGLRGTVFGISTISKMPAGSVDNEALVTAANSMVENAAVFKQTLTDHGLQPDCIDTLKAASAALKSSIDARGQAKSAGVGATKGIRADVLEGKKLVSFIDAGLKPLLKNDHAKLASWQNAKRITSKGVVGVIVPPVVTPAVVAAPSATPVAAAAQHAA